MASQTNSAHLIYYIRKVFSSLSCLNASFLKQEILRDENGSDIFYQPYLETLNIDFDEVEKTFELLKAMEDKSIEVK